MTHRGVVTISPGNLPDGCTPQEFVCYLESHGYAVVFAIEPERMLVDFDRAEPSQRERIALELMAAEVRRDGMFNLERAPEQAPFLAAKAVGYADALIEALNRPKGETP